MILDSLPTVSVVIPCYKQAHFVATAVASAVNQAGANVEVIVVDDGSPDDVSGALASFAGIRIVRQANAGLPAARNTGIRAATGEFIVFLDSDDHLYPGAIASGLAALAREPGASFAVGGYDDVYADGRRVYFGRAQQAEIGDQYGNILRFNSVGFPGAGLHRRAVVERHGAFDSSLRSCEDWDLYLRILRTDRFVAHPGPIGGYVQHPEGMSRNSGRMLATALEVLRRQREFIGRDAARRAALRDGIAQVCNMYQEPLIARFRNALRADGAGWRDAAAAARELLRTGGILAVRRLLAGAATGLRHRLERRLGVNRA